MALPRSVVAVCAVGAVALAGYAGWSLLDVGGDYDAMAQEAYQGPDGAEVDARAQAVERRERLAAAARGATRSVGAPTSDALDREIDAIAATDDAGPAPAGDPSGPVGLADAEAGFDFAMRRVEKIARKRKRVKVSAWEALYREANDAFSAYSIHLDASDPDQLAKLEEARRRLTTGLGRVRVRGGKKLAY